MRQRSAFASTAVTVCVAACSPTNPGSNAPILSGDASSSAETGPVFVENDADGIDFDAAPSPLVGIRVANWSPDAPPIDFCVAPHATEQFQGPMIAALLQAQADADITDDAGTPGIAFPQVSSYFYFSPGQYDARVVAAGSPDCNVGVLSPDDTNLLPSTVGTMTTLAFIGMVSPAQGEPSILISSFHDDYVTTFGDTGVPEVPLRFINASPSTPSMTCGSGKLADMSFEQFVAGVPFGYAGTQQEATTTEFVTPLSPYMVDGNGFVQLGQLKALTLSVHAFKAKTDLAVAPSLTVPPGIVVTVVAVGDQQVQLVECLDTAGAAGLVSSCSVVSQ
jgi:hypothetical protein